MEFSVVTNAQKKVNLYKAESLALSCNKKKKKTMRVFATELPLGEGLLSVQCSLCCHPNSLYRDFSHCNEYVPSCI